jgi:predicted nucleic acid-binding protein
MERLIYVLDTNVIADRMNAREPVTLRLTTAVQHGHQVGLCQPVFYEVMRGLLKTNATRKLHFFQTTICAPAYMDIAYRWRLAAGGSVLGRCN